MPATTPDQGRALNALAALLEAARQYIPGVGPLWAGVETYRQEIAQATRDLPSQAQDAIRAMARDLERFLGQEAPRHGGSAVEIALAEAFAILAQHGLSDDELAAEAGLDATQATRLTLDRARERLRPLEADTEELVRRLVGEYYRALLTHREALLRVGVPFRFSSTEQRAWNGVGGNWPTSFVPWRRQRSGKPGRSCVRWRNPSPPKALSNWRS